MRQLDIRYFRYVDDVLMHGSEAAVRQAHRSLGARLRRRGLSLHPIGSGKSFISRMDVSFDYLGYSFRWPKVTVRESTLEKLLHSLASKFSRYRHTTATTLAKYPLLTEGQLRQAFVDELNERITGLVSRNRKYGWIAYFNQITDLSLLHRLDSVVVSFFERLPDFTRPPPDLKKFSRAYFEMKFRPFGGYVQNYDAILSRDQQRAFLVQRGRLARNDEVSDEGIGLRFDAYRRMILRSMQADEGDVY
jgi:RNA-directed DNA polymerase